MQTLKLLLMLPLIFIAAPAQAAETEQTENVETKKEETPPERAERPQREAVKLSPHARESTPRPDESGLMKRVAPSRTESPLQHVPALMDPPPPPAGHSPAKP
ncbi:MAG TPA: hypothetical protein VFU39_09270 [Sulfuricaulis sp.]|nr:hypothetical protein [Sulfuricaulis sp.]